MKFRSFIAVEIDATEEIRTFIRDVEATDANINMVDPDKIHITVKFLGDVDEDIVPAIGEKVRFVLEDRGPFVLNLKGVGAFPSLDYMKVVWIGTDEKEEFSEIAHRMEEELVALGFDREQRSFSPHITVGRVKGGRNKNRLRAVLDDYREHDFGKQKVNKLKLKKSELKREGPEYTTIKEYYMY